VSRQLVNIVATLRKLPANPTNRRLRRCICALHA
jgi:hypothetical protein